MIKTNLTEAYYIQDLRAQLRADDLAYDPWGTVMCALFDACAELYYRHPEAQVLAIQEYSPGAAEDPREPEGSWFDVYINTDTGTLIKWICILGRYKEMLRTAGEDY